MMNERNKAVYDFVKGLYCPASLSEEYEQLKFDLCYVPLREIRKEDSNTIVRDCLIIKTKGRGKRETFKGSECCRVDIGEVGPKLVDLAIYYNGSNLATPRRVSRDNIRINIPLTE